MMNFFFNARWFAALSKVRSVGGFLTVMSFRWLGQTSHFMKGLFTATNIMRFFR